MGHPGSVSGRGSLGITGESTLIGMGGNNQGNELVEVYQLDRKNSKFLFTKSRIGTKTVMPLFSDTVMSCVGDASRVND